jgi:hypothetical protein
MPRAKTPSFVAEFPLRTVASDEAALHTRLDAARNIYNAALGESLRRLDLMRESREWRAACAMSKGAARSAERKARAAAFKAVQVRFGFSAGEIQKFCQECRDDCWIGDHLGSHDMASTSLRAFRAVEQYAFGTRGRPRFKGKNRLHSIEGKSNAAVIRYRADPVPAVNYAGLVLPLMLDPRDRDGWQAEALGRRVKYVRLIRRDIRSRRRWYAQLVLEGLPPQKARHAIGAGDVGLDIGPSTIAVVGAEDAFLEPFCPTITQPWKELRRIERAMDRSRRATNQDCFNTNGTFKKGTRIKVRSRRYQRLAMKRRERERRLAAERKRTHGELCNRILEQGSTIHTEKLSYKSFQKNFGRSVKVRAPGIMVSELSRKAESAGGVIVAINPRKTALSQFDHLTGEYVKKPLSQRIHVFGDGRTEPVQRDLYSAFLARHCGEDHLDIRQVEQAWPSGEPLLRRAMSRSYQSASGAGSAHPHPGTSSRVGADRASKKDCHPGEAADAYLGESRERAAESPEHGAFKTLCSGLGRFSKASGF